MYSCPFEQRGRVLLFLTQTQTQTNYGVGMNVGCMQANVVERGYEHIYGEDVCN